MHRQYIPLFRSWGQYCCILTLADWFERRKTGVVLTLVQEDCTTNGSSGATAVPVPRRKKIVLVLYNPGLTWIRRRPCTLWNCEHEAVLLLQPWVIHRCVYISYTAVPLLYTVLAILTILYSNVFRTWRRVLILSWRLRGDCCSQPWSWQPVSLELKRCMLNLGWEPNILKPGNKYPPDLVSSGQNDDRCVKTMI